MEHGIVRWLALQARPRVVGILALLELLVLGAENFFDFPLSVAFMKAATGGHPYLDMCAFCSGARVQDELVAFGARGRLLQALLLGSVDLVIPVLSCAFGLAALSLALSRGPEHRWRWVLVVPVAAMRLDFAENLGIGVLLVRYPSVDGGLATTVGMLSGLKFVAYGAVLLALLASGVARARRRFVASERS